MKNIRILNGDGNTVEIKGSETEYGTFVLSEVDNNSSCLTCGRMAKEPNELEVLNVSTHSLKNWLKDRKHFANEDDNVLLCEQCQEEAVC